MKFTRTQAIHYFKYVKKVHVLFMPFDGGACSSTREFWLQVNSSRLLKVNPKCELKMTVANWPTWPKVDVKFVDGQEINFNARHYKVEDMFEQIHLKAETIDTKYVLANKSIEDEI